MVALGADAGRSDRLSIYVNRLSDLLFVMARRPTSIRIPEIEW